jgi:hypothetical protein
VSPARGGSGSSGFGAVSKLGLSTAEGGGRKIDTVDLLSDVVGLQ